MDISKISGLGEYVEKTEILRAENAPETERKLYLRGEKVFLVINPHTLEVRTDVKLAKLLTEKYESVMVSRYFGNGGIEIVLAGEQLSEPETEDLIRLSYNLSA